MSPHRLMLAARVPLRPASNGMIWSSIFHSGVCDSTTHRAGYRTFPIDVRISPAGYELCNFVQTSWAAKARVKSSLPFSPRSPRILRRVAGRCTSWTNRIFTSPTRAFAASSNAAANRQPTGSGATSTLGPRLLAARVTPEKTAISFSAIAASPFGGSAEKTTTCLRGIPRFSSVVS